MGSGGAQSSGAYETTLLRDRATVRTATMKPSGESNMPGVTGICYVRYQAPDLNVMEAFLKDFGMTRSARTDTALYMRGTGTAHHIHVTELGNTAKSLAVGLRIDSRADLERIASRAGVAIGDTGEPGGGVRAVLTDPNGFRVELVQGQETLEPLPVREPLVLNDSRSARRLGQLQRPSRGASHVAKIEHAVLEGPNFEAALAFYCGALGMEVSDHMHGATPEDKIVAFLHCGVGSDYTDHHTIALAKGAETSFHHSAFVTLDWDDLMLGHFHLKDRGYNHEWGIGRHILGSEVFDYWRDPFGNRIEHCVDGDMVNDAHQPDNIALADETFSIWSLPATVPFA